MEALSGHGHFWNPFHFLGFTHSLFFINVDTILTTWFILLLLLVALSIVKIFINRRNPLILYGAKQFVIAFKDFVVQTLGFFHYHHCLLITVVFTFILLCNWISIIPGLEEPTADLNTTLALGLITFFYRDTYAIIEHGFWGFFKEFLHPFFLMFPLNVIGHLSKVLSISFRLFGNIFGGSIITKIYGTALGNSWIWNMLGLISGLNFVVIGFFVIFEGLIQAFVFSMLTLTYLAIAIQSSEEE